MFFRLGIAMSVASASFDLFGWAHLGAIAVTGVAAAGLCVVLRRSAGGPRGAALSRAICYALAALLVASWVIDNVVAIARGEWSLQESLPLHLCDIAVIVCAATLFGLARRPHPRGPSGARRGALQTASELAYFWGLAGTTQALLTPDIDDVFPSVVWLRFFTAHGGIIVAILVMTIGLKMRPRPGAPVRVWLATAALPLPVMLIDWLLGANYMFLCGPPEQPTLYDYLGPWPWTLLSLAILAAVLMPLCYLPFWLHDRRTTQAAA